MSKIYWISPSLIKYAPANLPEGEEPKTDKNFATTQMSYPEFGNVKNKIVNGDFDLHIINFEHSIAGMLLRSLIKVYKEKSKWEDSEIWQYINHSISLNIPSQKCRNIKDLHNRFYKFIPTLVKDMSNTKRFSIKYCEDYIGVAIGRNGEIIFNNGRNRLCVAKYLNLPKIPVVVNVRHAEWVAFKEKLKKCKIYAPLWHFDLQEFDAIHVNRIETIFSHIKSNHTKILDIGAHWGSCSCYLAQRGKKVLAVEYSKKYLYFLRKIMLANDCRFDVSQNSIFELKDLSHDTVLALRIFHHFIKNKGSFIQLTNLLRKLKIKELFLQPHDYKLSVYKNMYRNFTPDQFVDYIIQNSCLNKSEKIGDFTPGGPIYRIFKDDV